MQPIITSALVALVGLVILAITSDTRFSMLAAVLFLGGLLPFLMTFNNFGIVTPGVCVVLGIIIILIPKKAPPSNLDTIGQIMALSGLIAGVIARTSLAS